MPEPAVGRDEGGRSTAARGRRVAVLVLLAACVVGGVVAVMVLRSDDGRPRAANAPTECGTRSAREPLVDRETMLAEGSWRTRLDHESIVRDVAVPDGAVEERQGVHVRGPRDNVMPRMARRDDDGATLPPAPRLPRTFTDAAAHAMVCAIDGLSSPPDGAAWVAFRLEGRDGSLSSRIDGGTPALRDAMTGCLETHRTELAAATPDGAAFELNLNVRFLYWCRHPPAATGALDPRRFDLSVGGGKDGCLWGLVPAPFGYWLLACARADALRVAIEEAGNVEVATPEGASRASLERTATGFRLVDADGRVVLLGERNDGGYRLLDGGGRPVGLLAAGNRAHCPGESTTGALLRTTAGETRICCRERRCWCADGLVHAWDVWTDAGCATSSFAAAAAVFAAHDLPPEQKGALGAFLLSEDLP